MAEWTTTVQEGLRVRSRAHPDGHEYVQVLHLNPGRHRNRVLGVWLWFPATGSTGLVDHKRDKGCDMLPGASLEEVLHAVNRMWA